MPGSYDYRGSVLWLSFEGETSLAELESLIDAALRDPDRPEAPNVLTDVRGSTSVTRRPGSELREGAGLFGSRVDLLGGRIAILVGSELQFGVMRIASAHAEFGGLEAQVFRDPQEAEAWLAADPFGGGA